MYVCKLANLKCTYILVRQVFKGDNYSSEETIKLLDFFSATSIQGRQLFKGGNYLREYGNKQNLLSQYPVSQCVFLAFWGGSMNLHLTHQLFCSFTTIDQTCRDYYV